MLAGYCTTVNVSMCSGQLDCLGSALVWHAAPGTCPVILETVTRAGFTVLPWQSGDLGELRGPGWRQVCSALH